MNIPYIGLYIKASFNKVTEYVLEDQRVKLQDKHILQIIQVWFVNKAHPYFSYINERREKFVFNLIKYRRINSLKRLV